MNLLQLLNMIYTKEELKKLSLVIPLSLLKKLKRINGFINNNWDKYLEYTYLIKQGDLRNLYYISSEEIIFFIKTQQYFLSLINNED